MKVENINIDELKPYDKNPRTHSEDQIQRIMRSIQHFKFRNPILALREGNIIVAGHGRIEAAKRLKLKQVPVIFFDDMSYEDALAYIVADNRLAELAGWDNSLLFPLLEEIVLAGVDVTLTGFDADVLKAMDDFAADEIKNEAHIKLKDKFIIPPFSVLDTRQGYWQDRKRTWLALGFESHLGRLEGMLFQAKQVTNMSYYSDQRKAQKSCFSTAGATMKDGSTLSDNYNTSIFDPVLCEIAYRWFCFKGGSVLDPFAGGSVRGIVAGYLGNKYTGIDLRPEQIEANIKQRDNILTDPALVNYVCGDSRDLKDMVQGEFDLIFSCPPYFDLEVYSDDVNDISNCGEYQDFLKIYQGIINKAVSKLKNDRFAVFVVGDMRDKKGFYRNFVSDTISAFIDAGMMLYNEAILVNVAGSLPIRVGQQFGGYRKLGKMHQNVLVFYKGDTKNIRINYGEIEVHIPEAEAEESLNSMV